MASKAEILAQLEQLRQVVLDSLDDDPVEQETVKKAPPKRRPSAPKAPPTPPSETSHITSARRTPIQSVKHLIEPRHNKFFDDGKIKPELRLSKARTKKQKRKLAADIGPRTRPKSTHVVIRCVFCGRDEKVSAALAPRAVGEEMPHYRCNNCCTGKK